MEDSIKGKRRARRLVLQALYQWLMSGTIISVIESEFFAIHNMTKVDSAYFSRLLRAIPASIDEIEGAFLPFLDRPVASLNPIELTILRISSYELLYCPELPYRVVLDESVSLAREYGSKEGHRYVNGVLNNLAKKIRHLET